MYGGHIGRQLGGIQGGLAVRVRASGMGWGMDSDAHIIRDIEAARYAEGVAGR